MAQNTKNQRGKNVILISQPSERNHQQDLPRLMSRTSSFGSDIFQLGNHGLGRQSSVGGNLFKTFHTTEKPKQQPPKVIVPQEPKISDAQKYAQQCLEYQKYQFDDKIRLIIHRMAIRAYQNFKDKTDHKFLSFSIQKMLGIIAKKLLLNRFQLLFLQYVFEETKWKFDIQCIAEHQQQYISYAHLSDSQGTNTANKQLEIYFLYCSFYSKKSLNQLPADGKSNKGHKFNGLTSHLKTLCKKFSTYFQQWTQKSNVSNIKINPKTLNNIFKRLTYYSDRQPQDLENYCLLVEEILEISPAYNAEKGNKKRKTNKMKKQEVIQQKQEDIQNEQFINHQEVQSDEFDAPGPLLNNKKQTSYLSNVDGLEPQNYIRKQRMI